MSGLTLRITHWITRELPRMTRRLLREATRRMARAREKYGLDSIAYGAAIGAVLGAALRYITVRDALAAAIAALFGITVHGAPDTRTTERHFTDPYDRY